MTFVTKMLVVIIKSSLNSHKVEERAMRLYVESLK